jgi:hypothetical protein
MSALAESGEMRVLTVRQPWAWAIIHGGKNVENRTSNIAGDYHGPIAIHTALTYDASWSSRTLDDAMQATGARLDPTGAPMPWWTNLGTIIGIVDLTDVHKAAGFNPGELNLCAPHGLCSPWAEPDTHHLTLKNPRALAEPIPYRGSLGLRTLDELTTTAVMEGLQQ